VFLDRIGALLGLKQTPHVLDLLTFQSITVLHNGEPDEQRDLYDAVLDCREDGSWTGWKPAAKLMRQVLDGHRV
jgi:putative ATP-binding cassette transporter